jgi:hypothetical protein
MYSNATGVEQNFEEAAKWYQRAAERGNMSAQFALGDMYIAGSGVERDYATAGRLYLAAARQGHPEAQYNIGEMYAAGYGVEQNDIKAYMWSELSTRLSPVARQGRSERNRDAVGERLSKDQIDIARARADRCLETRYADCD